MNRFFSRVRFLVARRFTQGGILLLFVGGSAYGWRALQGTLSSSKLMGMIPLADPFAVLQGLIAGARPAAEALTGAVIIALFFGIIAGRAFCGWVCPVNIMTDAAGWVRKRLRLSGADAAIRIKRKTRYSVLGLSLVLSGVTGAAAFESASPIGMVVRGLLFGVGTGWLVVLAVFTFDALLVPNGFCGHVCPLGAFYSLLARFSLLRIRHDKERCTRCMRCVERCPEKQVLITVGEKSGPISSGECTLCGRCLDVCEDHAMKWGMRHGAKET